MLIRYWTILALVLFASQSASAQKIPLFNTVDSLKKTEKDTLSRLASAGAPKSSIKAVKGMYDDVIRDLRDSARDCADSIMDHMEKCSHFEIGFDLASRQLIYGRQGPASDVEGLPMLKYRHKSGVYGMFNADVYKLVFPQRKVRLNKSDTSSVSKIESDIVLTAGFARTFYKWWDIDLNINHTFIFFGQDKNYLTSSLNVGTTYDFWDYLSLDIYYSLYFGGSSKISAAEKSYSNVLTLGIGHDFRIYRFLGAKVFTITPEFTTDVGNDNLVRNRLLARNENGGLTVVKPATDNFFGLLDLVASVNFDYRIKNLDIYIDPSVTIPYNVVPAGAPSTAPYRHNASSAPIFYVTAGIKYLFRFWKEKPSRHK